MKDFFPIETPYGSEDYKLMKNAVNIGIDSHLEGFTKSEFKKSPHFNNKFLWNIHNSELPILYRRLADLYEKTGNEDYMSLSNEVKEREPVMSGEEDLEENGIENYIDDDTKSQEMMDEMDEAEFPGMEENSSDSLINKHGENIKPETLGETTDTEKYEDVVFFQGEEADEAMDILNNDGKDAALEFLKQWHYPGQHMGRHELPHGTQDKTYEKDGYIMAWNPYLPYIGLTYDTDSMNEDSQMKRHQAGQREKTVPLGQHEPHSQVAKK